MDIAAMSMFLKQSQVQQTASMAVMKMAMQTAQEGMSGITQAMASTNVAEQAVQSHLGAKLDVLG